MSAIPARLYPVHLSVPSATRHQVVVAALLDDLPAFEKHDPLGQSRVPGRCPATRTPGVGCAVREFDAAIDAKQAQAVGSFYQALMTGVIVQWLIDPERAPSGRDPAEALRMILANVQAAEAASDSPD